MGKIKATIGMPSKPDDSKRGRAFVQTEQSSHEAWARLTLKDRGSAALMHFLVSRMDRGTNSIVASHKTLSILVGTSTRSIRRWLGVLEEGRWIQIVSLGPGTSHAYVINSAVAWGVSRERLPYAAFHARVLALEEDQRPETLSADLRKIPVLFPGEGQLPHGEGDAPPSQTLLEGFEPELPSVRDDQATLPGLE